MAKLKLPDHWKKEIEQEILSNLRLHFTEESSEIFMFSRAFLVLMYKDKELSRIQIR